MRIALKGPLELARDLSMSVEQFRKPLVRGLRRMPYPLFHRAAVALARVDGQLRRPFSSRRARREARRIFSAVDSEGRLHLTPEVADQYSDYVQHIWAADMSALLLHLPDPGFRARSLCLENWQAIEKATAGGRGAVIAGLHLGPHAAIPLTLAQLGFQVAVMGTAPVLKDGRQLVEACLPEVSSRLKWLSVDDPQPLLRAWSVLRRGGLAVGFVDLSVGKGTKTTEIKFLGQKAHVPFGLPFLAAVARSSIVPASLIREPGPRFTLRLEEPLPPPSRDEEAIRRTLQALFRLAEERVLEHPDQWLGWAYLESALRVPLPSPAS